VSLAEIKEKVSAAINSVTNPPPPTDTTILKISKLCKGGFTVLFKEKEVVSWLQDPRVEFEFALGIAQDTTITKCVYSILIPHILLTFNPTEEKHLREVEESNKLPTGVIAKVRWIKPEYRRAPEQRAAHTIFAIKDISIANVCIRDGLYICGLRIHPSRLKHELMQCMKCRQWGHFAHACTANTDTCGTCGGEHRTSNCSNKEKIFCVSCKSDDHASWDQECPEFRRRCAQFNENYPENNLPYFPTDEDWTLTERPNRLQLSEKFPAKYVVSVLPQHNQASQTPVEKHAGRQRKWLRAKVPANQSTIDWFIVSDGTQGAVNSGEINNNNANDMNTANPNHPTFNCADFGVSSEPRGWN
jgi:hypothetical protein